MPSSTCGSATSSSAFFTSASLLVGAVDDPDRLAAPGDRHHVAGLETADVDLDRRTRRLGLFRWCKRTNKGYDSGHASNATCYGRRYQPGTAAAVDALHLPCLASHAPLLSWIYSFTSLLPPLVCANGVVIYKARVAKITCEVLDNSGFPRTIFRDFLRSVYLPLFVPYLIAMPDVIQTGLSISIKRCSISNCSERCEPTACTPKRSVAW